MFSENGHHQPKPEPVRAFCMVHDPRYTEYEYDEINRGGEPCIFVVRVDELREQQMILVPGDLLVGVEVRQNFFDEAEYEQRVAQLASLQQFTEEQQFGDLADDVLWEHEHGEG